MMDPNATLARIRIITHNMNNPDYDRDEMVAEYGDELAELITSLDTWLTRGGYLPTPWATAPRPPTTG